LQTNASVRATANVIAGVVLSCVYSLLIVWAVQWLEARVLRHTTAMRSKH
jgi:ABC-type nitrate/sulfonate/bicarbonate transport system permease component